MKLSSRCASFNYSVWCVLLICTKSKKLLQSPSSIALDGGEHPSRNMCTSLRYSVCVYPAA